MGEVDPKLLEMAEVFHVPKKAKMKYIVLPAKLPGLSKLLGGKGGKKAVKAGAKEGDPSEAKKEETGKAAAKKGHKGGSHR